MKERVKQLEDSGIAQIAGGVLLGFAAWNLVDTFVRSLLSPLISVFIGNSIFVLNSFTIDHSDFEYGYFLEAVLAAVVVVFLLAVAFTTLGERIRRSVEHAPSRISRWWFRTEKDEG
jgi:large conductance mechanosensitive channel